MKISVIIPVRNRLSKLERCLRSITNQSLDLELYEVIVIDDNSNLPVKDKIKLHVSNVKFLRNKNHLGLPASLNKGVKFSKNELIVRLDSDDYVHTEFLKILRLKFILSDYSYDAVASDYFIVDENENKISHTFAKHNPIGCGIMFRREVFNKIGLYNKSFKLAEDEELMIRFKKSGLKVDFINLPLYRYTKHSRNITSNKKKYLKFKEKLKC